MTMTPIEEVLGERNAAPTQESPEVGKEAEVAAQPEQQEESPEADQREGGSGNAPIPALHAERKKRQAAEEKIERYTDEVVKGRRITSELTSKVSELERINAEILRQLQQQSNPPETLEQKNDQHFSNPHEATHRAVQEALQPIKAERIRDREDLSLMRAELRYGKQTVDAAFNELGQLIQDGDQTAIAIRDELWAMRDSMGDPYGALVNWHKSYKHQPQIAEFSSDPEAYEKKIEERVLARLQQQPTEQNGQNGGKPPPVMPSNFTTARNVGARSGPAWAGPTPIDDIFKR